MARHGTKEHTGSTTIRRTIPQLRSDDEGKDEEKASGTQARDPAGEGSGQWRE